ncbi:MAG: Rieske (2Fe-2S) protein [Nocardioides sp.]
MTEQNPALTSRRIVFQGLGALGVAVALAGCGGGGDGAGAAAKTPDAGSALASVSDVPVGGGLILGDMLIVITQPTEGEFKAFTAVCTHEGNTVTSVEDGTIECSFHGSSYSAETGEVEGGPAPSALAEVNIKVDGDQIVTA